MRTLALILVAVAVICSQNIFAQGCLPEGITFTTQEQIDNFQINYPGCTEIEGDVYIEGDSVFNLNGLNNLNTIGGELRIVNTFSLTSLTGLNSLQYIGENLLIVGNENLENFSGLDNLISIAGYLEISCVFNLTNFTGLNNLETIGGHLYISNNSALVNFTGLSNLVSVGDYIFFDSNFSLTNLLGIENLQLIGGSLIIVTNHSLTNLTGLETLTSIGGGLVIEANEDLTSLTALEGMTYVGGDILIMCNYSLTSLLGIENIQPNSIEQLYIRHNTLLNKCEVQSICEYLTNPGEIVEIYDNAPGCNSPDEVLLACETAIDENKTEALSISPNPATSFITLTSPQGEPVNEVIIYNHLAQKVLTAKPVNNTVDVSGLRAGIYLIDISVNDRKEKSKFVKQ